MIEGDVFQHAMKAENRKYFTYDDGQEQKEAKEDVKPLTDMLEEDGKKGSEYFMSLEWGLEQQEEGFVTGSSNETIGSSDFEIDILTVFAAIAEGNLSLGFALNEVENFQARYVKEYLSDED